MFIRCVINFLVLTLLTGVLYPLAVTGVGQMLFPQQANGSLITKDNKLIGSKLIGQKFTSEKYFWGRPSAVDYNTLPSGASNLSPTSTELKNTVEKRRAYLVKSNPEREGNIPPELLLSSGSGVDPEISLFATRYQVERVAKARGLEKSKIEDLINAQVKYPTLIFMGMPRINVLELNLALDAMK